MDTNNLSDGHKPLKQALNSQECEPQEDVLFQCLVEAESLIEVFLASEIANHDQITLHAYFCALNNLITRARKISENLAGTLKI